MLHGGECPIVGQSLILTPWTEETACWCRKPMGYPTAILLVFPGEFDVFFAGLLYRFMWQWVKSIGYWMLGLVALRVFETHTKIIFLEAFLGVLISSEVFLGGFSCSKVWFHWIRVGDDWDVAGSSPTMWKRLISSTQVFWKVRVPGEVMSRYRVLKLK